VITWLSGAGHPLWFFWYVAVAAAVAFAVILTLRETKGTELR
jgi:MHS family alpha-ketoglutarate permease-like MFS transporter